jgi:hypothetical protein
MGMSNDGSTIIQSGPTGADPEVWREGVTAKIGSTLAGDHEGVSHRGMMISPNGRYVVFSSAALAGQDYDNTGCAFASVDDAAMTDRCIEVYIYDVDERKLECASCPPDGARSTGHAHLAPLTVELSRYGGRRVNDAGQALFDTPTGLVPEDTNGTRDVYVFQNGEASLISPGTSPNSSYVADASASFDDIFFITDQPLVGQDSDNQYDVYDARVGGGIASQSGHPPDPGCSAADCRAAMPSSPRPPSAGSEAVSGTSSSPPRRQKKHRHKKQKARAPGHKRHRKTGAARQSRDPRAANLKKPGK